MTGKNERGEYPWEERGRIIRQAVNNYMSSFSSSNPLALTAKAEGWWPRLRVVAEMKAHIQAQVIHGASRIGCLCTWMDMPIEDPVNKARSYITWLIREAEGSTAIGVGFSEREVAIMRGNYHA